MSFRIRRTIPLLLCVALAAGLTSLPAGASADPVAVASKCKKKGKRSASTAKKKKKCRKSSRTDSTLPGVPTWPTPQPPGPGGSGSGGSGPGPEALLVSDVRVTDNPVLGGTGTSGDVTISGPAPTGGQPVALSADPADPARASVPASVHVAAGQTSASFPVTTTAGPTVVVPLTASIGPSADNVQLNVVEEPSVVSVELDYQCYPPGGGVFTANRVTLDVPAPADTPVALQSNDPALSVPASVTVPEGQKTQLFDTTAGSTAAESVTVTASLNGSSAFDIASVRDGTSPSPSVAALSLSPTSVQPGDPSTGTVTLNCEALAAGSTVNLASTNEPDVHVDPSVTVTEGNLSATFPISTTLLATGETTITANPGPSQQQATLTIDDLGT